MMDGEIRNGLDPQDNGEPADSEIPFSDTDMKMKQASKMRPSQIPIMAHMEIQTETV